MQIVGRPFDEDTVFRAGLAFERARGAWFTGHGPKPVDAKGAQAQLSL
jgi:Asp-tRNA(Asn)/Glu-tRNA(Gln) amidotransferase A subunit family amidase